MLLRRTLLITCRATDSSQSTWRRAADDSQPDTRGTDFAMEDSTVTAEGEGGGGSLLSRAWGLAVAFSQVTTTIKTSIW